MLRMLRSQKGDRYWSSCQILGASRIEAWTKPESFFFTKRIYSTSFVQGPFYELASLKLVVPKHFAWTFLSNAELGLLGLIDAPSDVSISLHKPDKKCSYCLSKLFLVILIRTRLLPGTSNSIYNWQSSGAPVLLTLSYPTQKSCWSRRAEKV